MNPILQWYQEHSHTIKLILDIAVDRFPYLKPLKWILGSLDNCEGSEKEKKIADMACMLEQYKKITNDLLIEVENLKDLEKLKSWKESRHAIRQNPGIQKHLELVLPQLCSSMSQYMGKNFNHRKDIIMSKKRRVNQSLNNLERSGRIDANTAESLGRKNENREVEMPDLQNLYHDPVFCCFLIDASGSMHVCQKAVIESQPIMLNMLRDSEKCKHGALFVAQYLFNNTFAPLHSFMRLGNIPEQDGVILLNESRYSPDGSTALYKTIYSLLQDISVIMDQCEELGLSPQFTLALITDGEDTEGGVKTATIQNFIGQLRNKKILRSSVVIGLVNQQLDMAKLKHIQQELAFDQAISCSKDSPREIRRAFVLASQSVTNHYKG